MFHVVLYEPEIPPNTGNVIRLCANSGTQLHLIRPLGFRLEDRELKRVRARLPRVRDAVGARNLGRVPDRSIGAPDLRIEYSSDASIHRRGVRAGRRVRVRSGDARLAGGRACRIRA